MALTAGTLAINVQYAQGLKDQDWFGKQDPYAIVKCGTQTYRTKTAIDGGKSPVWNETFTFNVINENSIEIEIKDEDTFSRDDVIGTATFSLAKAREHGSDTLQAPVVGKKSKKQHGFVAITLKYITNDSIKPAAAQQQSAPQQPQVVYAHAPSPYGPYGAQLPMMYGQYGASPMYGAPAPYPYPYAQAPAPYAYPYGAAPAPSMHSGAPAPAAQGPMVYPPPAAYAPAPAAR